MERRKRIFGLAALVLVLLPTAGCPRRQDSAAPATAAPATKAPSGSPQVQWVQERKAVLEAEAGELIAPLVAIPDEGAAGGNCVVIPEGPNFAKLHEEGEGQAVLRFSLPEAGDYHLWARVFFPHECADSFYLVPDGPDDPARRLTFQDSTHAVWNWIRPLSRRPLTLAAGEHALRLVNREDGARIDQLLLTTDERVPVDIENAP